MNIKREELEDVYKINSEIRQYIKYASDNLTILSDILSTPAIIKKDDLLEDINKIITHLKPGLPYELDNKKDNKK
jgi:hypothetical protein